MSQNLEPFFKPKHKQKMFYWIASQDDDLDGLEHGARLAAAQLHRLREEHAEVEDDPSHDLRRARAGDQAVVEQPLHGVGWVPKMGSWVVLGRLRLPGIVNQLFSTIFRQKNQFFGRIRFGLIVRN